MLFEVMRTVDNESGLSYGIMGFIVVLFIAGLVYIAFTPLINGVVDEANKAANGTYGADFSMSQQTGKAIEYTLNFWTYGTMVFVLIILAIWLLNRALWKKKTGGY